MTSIPAQSSIPKSAAAPSRVDAVALKEVTIGLRSRFVIWLLRRFLRPWLAYMIRGPDSRIARLQLTLAAQSCDDTFGLTLDYSVIGPAAGGIPGHVLGDLGRTDAPVVLWLHGGAFIMPAVPAEHARMLAQICRDLGASGFLPDYRLAPFNKFPAALDDCERSYKALLDLGFDASCIALGGESAGGNLVFGLLQRIRKNGWPMPACAVPVSPATEMGRIYAPPSRALKRRRDPILPIEALFRVNELYAGGVDTANPELSPLFADCSGFPPLYFLASDAEVLLDDTVLLARRAREAGVAVELEVWPIMPHAFPLMENWLPEARGAREDITAFMRRHLPRSRKTEKEREFSA